VTVFESGVTLPLWHVTVFFSPVTLFGTGVTLFGTHEKVFGTVVKVFGTVVTLHFLALTSLGVGVTLRFPPVTGGVFTELCLPYFLGSRNYTCLLG